MHPNQYNSTGASANFNVRLTPEMRERLHAAALKHHLTDADVHRAALAAYLPILESTTPVKPE